MQAVILAGGLGTRLSEETVVRPKPLVEIGGFPILWHIMKMYELSGVTDFIVCLGFKGYLIKEYFFNYFYHNNDLTVDLKSGSVEVLSKKGVEWKITLVDTGDATMTGGRIKRIGKYIQSEEFCVTYGDGVSDVCIADIINFHRTQKRLATVTAVLPPGRFGALQISQEEAVTSFSEKPNGDGTYINGGFFVFNRRVLDYIPDDSTVLEVEPLKRLAEEGQLSAFKHHDFWHPMDTLRDKNYLEDLWRKGMAPWKKWD